MTVSGATNFYNLTISHSAAKEVIFSVSGAPIFGVSNPFTATELVEASKIILSSCGDSLAI